MNKFYHVRALAIGLLLCCHPDVCGQLPSANRGEKTAEYTAAVEDDQTDATGEEVDRSGDAGEVTEIPISRVWAYGIPGTVGYVVGDILGALPKLEEREPFSNFVVAGTGLDALLACHDVLVKNEPRQSEFPDGTHITLGFFPRAGRWPIKLHSVERRGGRITVRYRFEPPKRAEHCWWRFALIPLGQLPARGYHVVYERMPLDPEYRSRGFEDVPWKVEHDVGSPFDIGVLDIGRRIITDDPAHDRKTDSIPLERICAYEMPGTRSVNELISLETTVDADGNRIPFLIRHGQGPIFSEVIHRAPFYDQPVDPQATRRSMPEDFGPGFVVPGEGVDALHAAHRVIVQRQVVAKELPANVPVTCVFFAFGTSGNMALHTIERRGTSIKIAYSYLSSTNREAESYLALIPLGKLQPGEYRVSIRRERYTDTRVEERAGQLDRRVNRSFSFVVTDD